MDETAAMIGRKGGRSRRSPATSATTPRRGRDARRRLGAQGPIDGLVNNAGIIRRADALDFTEADWDDVMDVNLKSLFLLTPGLRRRRSPRAGRARVVNIASVLSFQGGIRVASYTASKHGVVGITRLLANEWAAKGINVNAIAPGYVESNNTEALRADPDRSAAILPAFPPAAGASRATSATSRCSCSPRLGLYARRRRPGGRRLAGPMRRLTMTMGRCSPARDGEWVDLGTAAGGA
jgi:2-dehydro-3-deoxy-D-gluconate 5-dehydrogenase